MSNKITIIGAGNVGSTIAYTMAVKGVAAEIVMIDINKEKAFGEAMDIRQGAPFCHALNIYSGDYGDAANSDIVIVTSGIARKAGQSRIDLAQTNVNILKSITEKIVKHAPNAVYLFVNNPVDILTYVFSRISGVPDSRILGSGTILDTSRLKARIADTLAISQRNVHAFVLGEHGDSSFIPWSMASVAGIPVDDYRDCLDPVHIRYQELDHEAIEEYVRTSGAVVIKNKGATFFAVSVAVTHICECICSGRDTVLPVSCVMHGEYGVTDVSISLPAIVGAGGIKRVLTPKFTDEEMSAFMHSVDTLKSAIAQLDI